MKKHANLGAWILVLALSCLLVTCRTDKRSTEKPPVPSDMQLPDRPNILWLVTEDMGPYIPPFGDSTIKTPNLSRLASEGIIYPNLYSPSGVCAPSRAAIATGMYPSGIGGNHMRTNSYTEFTGLSPYEAVTPPEVRMLSELLRMNDYYCTNNAKGDYQFQAPVTAWDESSYYAHWRNRKNNQPFFSVFNFTVTHESGLFEPYGFRKNEARHYHSGDTSFLIGKWSARTTEEETPVHIAKDTNFPVPPYLPDNEVVRRDLWKLYNNIFEMDRQLGAILDQLEADGLMDSTIIFFYADHGGPLPRQKRLIYDGGLNAPMIIRFPDKQRAGSKDDQLISFVDFVPTVLSLVGSKPPAYLQGQAFLGKYRSEEPRNYVHAAADRFDAITDVIRAVRGKRFKYIRNYRPEQGYYLPIAYRERIPSMQELLRLHEEGKLNEHQSLWFREKKDPEELYDCLNDPHELKNLVADPAHAQKLQELREEMDVWLHAIGDKPNLPERDLITQLWQGKDEQPVTDDPVITAANGGINIDCSTPGASIGYKIVHINRKGSTGWEVYQEPFAEQKGIKLMVQAHRMGFKPSNIIEFMIPD